MAAARSVAGLVRLDVLGVRPGGRQLRAHRPRLGRSGGFLPGLRLGSAEAQRVFTVAHRREWTQRVKVRKCIYGRRLLRLTLREGRVRRSSPLRWRCGSGFSMTAPAEVGLQAPLRPVDASSHARSNLDSSAMVVASVLFRTYSSWVSSQSLCGGGMRRPGEGFSGRRQAPIPSSFEVLRCGATILGAAWHARPQRAANTLRARAGFGENDSTTQGSVK